MNFAATSPRPTLAEARRIPKFSQTSPLIQATKTYKGHTVKIPDFGSFSPHWTIGSSRRPPKQPDETPGPGQYEVIKPLRSAKNGRSISPYRERSYRTITSDIDVPNIRDSLRGPRGFTVGSRSQTVFYIPTDGAGSYIMEKSTLSPRGHRIAKRIEDKPNDNPGPGAYSPDYSQPPKLATMDRSKEREIFKPAEPDTPGPGAYNVGGATFRSPKWFARKRVTKKSDLDED